MDVYGEDVACHDGALNLVRERAFLRSRENYKDICIHTKADGGEDSEDKIEDIKEKARQEGKADKLDVDNLLQEMKKTSISSSKFFARDQFGKFNKALMLASYREAGVKRVRWICVDDMAVRGRPGGASPNVKAEHNHWKNNGKIFDITKIPLAFWDYLCRCFLEPVWN